MTINTYRSAISKISLAMLLMLSMAFFVVPSKQVEAQAKPQSSQFYFCFNTQNGAALASSLDSVTGQVKCPITPSTWTGQTGLKGWTGICVYTDAGVVKFTNPVVDLDKNGNPTPRLDSNDKTKCVNSQGVTWGGTYKSWTSMPQAPNSTPTNTNSNTNTNKNTNNSNQNSNNTNKSPANPSNNTTPTTQNQGGCEPGFHEVGPLCVPNSPFTNPNALVNSGDASSLAVKIIKILLYFAAIVAVIMMIIGGYYVMTAQGNATQAANGRKTLTNAIVGLVIIILSYFIIQVVINFVTK
jgi:hypothetical protein